jgi:hypothetical protein
VYPCTSSFWKGSMRLKYSQLLRRIKTSSKASSFSGTESEVTALKKCLVRLGRSYTNTVWIKILLLTTGVMPKQTGIVGSTAREIVLAYSLFKYLWLKHYFIKIF